MGRRKERGGRRGEGTEWGNDTVIPPPAIPGSAAGGRRSRWMY